MTAKPTDPVERLVRALEPERLGGDVFRVGTGRREGRIFGGLTMAQAVMVAGRTVDRGALHSLHGYFLRAGRVGSPTVFRVERPSDGRSFRARRVVGEQDGEPIVELLASFATERQGFSHEDPMPPAPPPEGLPDWESMKARRAGTPTARPALAMEMRICEPIEELERPGPARFGVWVRPRGRLPDDPLIHAAFLVFASDRVLLRVAARPHGAIYDFRNGASLDHSIWLHRPPRCDDWMLYACQSPAAQGGRALAFGAFYTRDGRRVASVAQEGILGT